MEWFALITTLVGFGIWLYKRHVAKASDPIEKHRQAYAEADKPVTKPSVALSDSLDEFDRLRNPNSKQ